MTTSSCGGVLVHYMCTCTPSQAGTITVTWTWSIALAFQVLLANLRLRLRVGPEERENSQFPVKGNADYELGLAWQTGRSILIVTVKGNADCGMAKRS